MAKEVAKTTEPTTALARVDSTPAALLAVAVQKDLDLEKLKGLMDLQERWERNEARKAFFKALSDFQAEMPPLSKDATVDFSTSKGRTHYRHASLGAISEAIREPLHRHGLSYRFEIANAEDASKGLTVTCIVSHEAGHSERTTMGAPPDDSGNKNAIQSLGSTVTYMQRYTLIAALGLVTADDDTDGRPAMTGPAKHEPAPKVPADFPPVASVGAPPPAATSKPRRMDAGNMDDIKQAISDISDAGERVRGRIKEIAPRQYWKKQKSGAMKKTIELEEYPGLKWTTLSNPEDPKHPWGAGDEVSLIAGLGKEGLVDFWEYNKKTYAVAEEVRPVSADGEQGDLPLDEPIEGEVVEDSDPFEPRGAAGEMGNRTEGPATQDEAPPAAPHFQPRRDKYTEGGAMPHAGGAAGARSNAVSGVPASAPAAPAEQNLAALRTECVRLERFLAQGQKVPFADIADGYEEACGARSLYSSAITAAQMVAIRGWLRQWCANLVPEFDPAKDDGVPF